MQRTCLAIAIAIAAVSSAASAHAAPVPSVCGAYAVLTDGKATALHATGKVKSIKPRLEPTVYAIVIADAAGDRGFDLSLTPPVLPFKVGDTIDVQLRRGDGWHRVHDALIKDAGGKVLIIASGTGADDWADGWKVTRGKVVRSNQNPNTKAKSVERTHALDVARGKVKATIGPDGCTLIQDGAERYIVAGEGITWVGERPPEGVDYQRFSMIRW